jgi:hypothetical protein
MNMAIVRKNARSFWLDSPGKADLKSQDLPARDQGWSTIISLFSGISPGTESLVFSGQVPENLHEQMRVPYMEGDFRFPIKYGYSAVGRVIETDDPFLAGKTVHLLHPHQDIFVARNEDLFVVDESVPPERATLASNLETAVNAIWDSQVTVGQRCIVVGFGIIGSLIARILKGIPGVEVVVVDAEASKLLLANKMEFDSRSPEEVQGEFDLAFHASCSGEGLQLCIDKVGFEGKVVELSWYGNRKVALELGGEFHSKRKAIICSQVSTIPAQLQRRWNYKRRKELVFNLLKDPAFDSHITEMVPFEGLPAYYESGGLKKPGLARVVQYER